MMKNKKILITGSNGLLGQKLVELLSKENVQVVATSRGENRLARGAYLYRSMDITDPEEVALVLGEEHPDVVMHTAAMTNVDQCELHRDEAYLLNVTAVEYLIKGCEANDIFLVHVSTDFIFSGEEGPLKEDAKPDPVNYYGETKLIAEQKIIESNIRWAIARTVLVYGVAQDMSRSNIILWVKNNLEAGKKIQVVDDQYRTPTLAEDLAIGCWLIAKNEVEGIFNISGKDMLTPYEIALKTAEIFELDRSLISRTDSATFTQPAKRPPKTGFIVDKARKELNYEPHSFSEGVRLLKAQLSHSE